MTKVFMTLPDGNKHEIKPFTAKSKSYINVEREKIRLELIEALKPFIGVKVTKEIQDEILQILNKFSQKYQLNVKVDDGFFDNLLRNVE